MSKIALFITLQFPESGDKIITNYNTIQIFYNLFYEKWKLYFSDVDMWLKIKQCISYDITK